MRVSKTIFTLPVLALIANLGVAGEMPGSELFEHHGCSNCHGVDGNDPVSQVVPRLAGKPAEKLFNKAKVILSGEGASKESEIMHAAFYSPSQCDHPPTDAELKRIVTWLSMRI